MKTTNFYNKILLLGVSSLLLGVSWVLLFYKEGIGLNYSLFVVLVVGLGLLLSRMFAKKLEREHYFVVAAGVFFSLMVFVRSSELLTFFNILGSLLLLLIAVNVFAGKHIRSFIAGDYLLAPFLPLRFIGPFFETLPVIISFGRPQGGGTKTKEIVRGSFMATVALIIFTILLSSADAGFEKLLSNTLTLKIDQDLINKIFLGTFIGAFFVGAFGFMFNNLHASPAPSPGAKVRNLGAIETMILFGSINALFFVFILLQISYLFGGASHLLAQGLTYAEYAREGFFQLVWVAIISFLVISFAEKQIIQHDGLHLRSFKILSGILVLQIIAILVSAFSRLSLYEDSYGFTTIRLYSHALMIWLGVTLALLSWHIWKNGKRTDFSFRAFCSVILLLFIMNLLNPDVFIAKKNLERYQSTGQIDAGYLGSLTDDALPYTVSLLNDPKEEIRKNFVHALYDSYCGTIINCPDGVRKRQWQGMRLNQKKSDELISSRRKVLEESMDWSEGIFPIQLP